VATAYVPTFSNLIEDDQVGGCFPVVVPSLMIS